MKRVAALCLALTLVLAAVPVLAGCTGPAQPGQTSIRVGVSVYDRYDTFIGEMMKHFEVAAQQMADEAGVAINVMRESADNSQAAQNNQVESFIAAGCDVVCVNLVDRTDVALIIDAVTAAGIPCLFFNRELVEEDLHRSDLLYYVGAEAAESGRMQGEIVIDSWKPGNPGSDKNQDGVMQYVMLEGEAGHQDAIVRTETSVNTVAEAGIKMERLEDEIASWIRSRAETLMAQWLEGHDDVIEVVFANNDDMALGAIDALKALGLPMDEWPIIVGIDGTPVGIEAVVRGEMTGTVYNDAAGQAQGLLDLAFAISTGGELPQLQDGKYIRLPYKPITRDNVIDFIGN